MADTEYSDAGELRHRTPLEMVMWAAWLGVDPENVPDALRGHTCPDTMARWKRVGEAAIAYARESEE